MEPVNQEHLSDNARPFRTPSSPTSETPAWLRVEDVAKAFGGAQALDGVSLRIQRGRVHGLVGANGAGKSTLIKCLAGLEHPDSGSIYIDDELVHIRDAQDASKLGLAFIHQEVSLVPGFDVLRNMTLGLSPKTRMGIIDWRELRERAGHVAKQLGMDFPLNTRVDSLSTADQWLVLIGRALMRDVNFIAMDEPTASLSVEEAEHVHEVVRDLRARGVAVVYVSHRLDEVLDLCDDVTVFRDGRVVMSTVLGDMDKPSLVKAIVGHEIAQTEKRTRAVAAEPVLELEGVSDDFLDDISFTVRRGEILGLAGLVGAGRTEIARIIYGDAKKRRGTIRLDGSVVDFKNPAQAAAAGIGFVPEERRAQGIFAERSISFNAGITTLRAHTRSRLFPLLQVRGLAKQAAQVSAKVQLNTDDMRKLVGTLSGGNQQKVVISRWLAQPLKLLILDEPSRGVDVGARAEIHRVIQSLADQGTSVIAISSDVDEIVELCDRVLVMNEGHLVGELAGDDIRVEQIIAMSFHRKDPQ